MWVSSILKEMGVRVIVANTRKLRMIWADTNKCDEKDAEKIARVARMDPALLHGIEHRSISAQKMLSVIRIREHFVGARTKCINCARGMLKSLGVTELPSCESKRFSERMLEHIPDELIPTLGELLGECEDLTNRIEDLDDRIYILSEESCPEAVKLQKLPGGRSNYSFNLCFNH